jgi:hypothetical protein
LIEPSSASRSRALWHFPLQLCRSYPVHACIAVLWTPARPMPQIFQNTCSYM